MKNYVPFVLAVILLSACIGVSACAPASSSSQAASESSQATDASSAASAEPSAASDDSSQATADSPTTSDESSEASMSAAPDSTSAAADQQTASSSAEEAKVRIGVAWRPNQQSLSYVSTCRALEAADIDYVVLDQVLSPDFTYDANNMLTTGKTEAGTLTAEAGKLVRCNTWQDSDVASMLEGINAVVFPGGEDISPSLYYDPQPVQIREGFSAERDVSDYLLMTYCLEQDIAILAICRGMQLLSVVCGAEMMQDIPEAMAALGLDYAYDHRNEPEAPDAYRDFAFHDVTVTDRASLLYRLVGADVIKGAPSWHHQAVKSVAGTRLAVTGVTQTCGIDMIEAVERPDKAFVLGIQFHPEIAVVRGLDDTSLCYFTAIVEAAQ